MQKGFTLIELMIVVAIITIIASVVVPAITSKNTYMTSQGTVAVKCIEGYKYTVSSGISQQMFDTQGHGIICER